MKDDEVIGFTLKRGETIIEVDFGPYGLSKALRTRSVWVSNPRPEMTREEYIRSIIRRFGLNFERLEGEPSVMGWRWRSVDRHEIIVDLKVPEKDGPPIIHMFIP